MLLLMCEAKAAPFEAAESAPKINVREAGAVGDGVADDTAALQKALDGGHRTVVIPSGTYSIHAALKMDSQTTIRANPDAVVRLADGAGKSVDIFLLTNRDYDAGNTKLTVEGGIWDGNNAHNPRGRADQKPCYTGVGLNFIHVRGLVLRNLVVRNPDAYAIRACRLSDFVIEKIGFEFTVLRPNQDGVHLDGFCEHGTIRDVRALTPMTTNDDMIALNADDGSPDDYVIQQGMVQGPIRDIVVDHLRGESVFTFVRLLSYRAPIENITVSDVEGGVRFYAVNMDRWRFPPGGGNIRHVTLRDFRIHKVADPTRPKASALPLILMNNAAHELRLENIRRDPADLLPAPTLMIDTGQRNRIQLDGLSNAQESELRGASSAVKPEMLSRHVAGERVDLELDADAKIALPRGGFSLLTVDSAALDN